MTLWLWVMVWPWVWIFETTPVPVSPMTVILQFDLHPCHTLPKLSTGVNMFPPSLDDMTHNFVFFKHESLYLSQYTTYDMWCRTDIVKPEGPHCNIMLLANHTSGSNSSNLHHFIYARVSGVYHADVIYNGPGMQKFEAHAFQMLWVRWYEVVDPGSSGWISSTMDILCFPPLHQDNSFGFVDLEVVL